LFLHGDNRGWVAGVGCLKPSGGPKKNIDPEANQHILAICNATFTGVSRKGKAKYARKLRGLVRHAPNQVTRTKACTRNASS
jgi:hypothetical protein